MGRGRSPREAVAAARNHSECSVGSRSLGGRQGWGHPLPPAGAVWCLGVGVAERSVDVSKQHFTAALFSETSEPFSLKLPSKFQPEADAQYGKHQSEVTRLAQRSRRAIRGSLRALADRWMWRCDPQSLQQPGGDGATRDPVQLWASVALLQAGRDTQHHPARRSPAACPASAEHVPGHCCLRYPGTQQRGLGRGRWGLPNSRGCCGGCAARGNPSRGGSAAVGLGCALITVQILSRQHAGLGRLYYLQRGSGSL